jgi:hypothetical protein
VSDQTVSPTSAQEMARGLRELADWLDGHPDMPVGSAKARFGIYDRVGVSAEQCAFEKGEFLRGVLLLADGPSITPTRSNGYLTLERQFEGRVSIVIECPEALFAPRRPAPRPWPEEIRALAPDVDWGDEGSRLGQSGEGS